MRTNRWSGRRPPLTAASVQQAAGMDHIYDFSIAGDGLADTGFATASDLTLTGTLTHAAPTVTGTAGSFENTSHNAANYLSSLKNIDMSRMTGEDVFWESIISFAATPPTAAAAIYLVGDYTGNLGDAAHSWCVGLNGIMYITDPQGGYVMHPPHVPTTPVPPAPMYFANWWDGSVNRMRTYWKVAGSAEGEGLDDGFLYPPTATRADRRLWIGGDASHNFSSEMIVHMFGIHQGALTAEHRANIYAATGLDA